MYACVLFLCWLVAVIVVAADAVAVGLVTAVSAVACRFALSVCDL